MATYLCFNNS